MVMIDITFLRIENRGKEKISKKIGEETNGRVSVSKRMRMNTLRKRRV